MAYKTIQIKINGAVTTLWLNRSEKHNALNPEMMDEMINFLEEVETDESIRVIVIRGRGKSFCAGADLQWMLDSTSLSKEENDKEAHLLSSFFATVHQSTKIIIGISQGNIFGGGVGLLAACDLAYGLKSCTFSLSETRIGMIAASISPYMLHKLNPSVYKELVFTARRFNGAVAENIGLLNSSFESEEELDEHLENTIKMILGAGPRALIGSKQLINDLIDPATSVSAKEQIPGLLAAVRITDEAHEGFSAFLEKRKPKWHE
jgi:methylglutaconyl-CoA hydratase